MAGATDQSLTASCSSQRYKYRMAEAGDDAGLRQLLVDTPMDGPIQVTLRCEPSYFDAAKVQGHDHRTIIACDNRSQAVIGMGSRSVRNRFVDGQATPVGYLSGMRLHPLHRSGTLVARAFRSMRLLHDDGGANYYLTTIAAGNERATQSLSGGRARLPTYFRLGKYHTFVIPLRRRTKTQSSPGLEIRPLQETEFPKLVEFLQQVGKPTLFFPCYNQEDFQGPDSTFRDLDRGNILTAWRGSQLVGTLAIWDQGGFKQSVVEGYRAGLQFARHPFNMVASLMDWPRFPAVGQELKTLFAALPLVVEGDQEVFSRLLLAASQHAKLNYPRFRSLLVGAFELDPLFEICRRASLYQYVTDVFLVYWDDQLEQPQQFLGRNLYLELGCL